MLLFYDFFKSLYDDILNTYYSRNIYSTLTLLLYLSVVLSIAALVQFVIKPDARRNGVSCWQQIYPSQPLWYIREQKAQKAKKAREKIARNLEEADLEHEGAEGYRGKECNVVGN